MSTSKVGLKVIGDVYLIEEDEMEKYQGKLFIPDAFEDFYKKVPDRGTVVAKGDKLKYDLPMGARVLFGRFAGSRIKHLGRNFQLMRERDILAILD